jgi:hypothetical protein
LTLTYRYNPAPGIESAYLPFLEIINMKKYLVLSLVFAALMGCQKKEAPKTEAAAPAAPAVTAPAAPAMPAAPGAAPAAPDAPAAAPAAPATDKK